MKYGPCCNKVIISDALLGFLCTATDLVVTSKSLACRLELVGVYM